MDVWDMPGDISVAQLFLEWAAASGGHSGNLPYGVLQGFPYKHAWGYAHRADKMDQVSVAAGDRDIWVGLEYMLWYPQNWPQFGHR